MENFSPLADVYLVARTSTWEVLMRSASPRPFTHCKKIVAATRIRTRDQAAGASLSAHSLATTLATDHASVWDVTGISTKVSERPTP